MGRHQCCERLVEKLPCVKRPERYHGRKRHMLPHGALQQENNVSAHLSYRLIVIVKHLGQSNFRRTGLKQAASSKVQLTTVGKLSR